MTSPKTWFVSSFWILLLAVGVQACSDEPQTPDAQPTEDISAEPDASPPDLRREPADPPEVTSLQPAEGPLGGNVNITVVGRNLEQPTAVYFGEIEALSVGHIDIRVLSVRVPPASEPGPVDVVVENRNGSATLEGGFTYLPSTDPNVVSLDPERGALSGGDTITVEGANFPTEGTITVVFGGAVAEQVTLDTDSVFSVITPANPFGPVDVTFNFDGFIQVVESGFDYWQELALSDALPNVGAPAGGTEVVLHGSGLFEAAELAVIFGETEAEIVPGTFSGGAVTALSPEGVEGVVDIIATGSNGEALLEQAFTYGVPMIVGDIEPADLTLEGGEVTVFASGIVLEAAISVVVGDGDDIPATLVEEDRFTFQAPAQDSPGVFDLLIQQDEQRLQIEDALAYVEEE